MRFRRALSVEGKRGGKRFRKAVVAGCFDLLHPGHLRFFLQAKRLARSLCVVVARDESVLKAKGAKPLIGEGQRLELVRGLRSVDEAVLGNAGGEEGKRNGRVETVLALKPDLLLLGYDQRISASEERAFAKAGIAVKRAKAFQPRLWKSGLLKKLLEKGV